MAGFRKSVAGVPASVWAALAAVSVVNVVAHLAVLPSLPAQVPVHWGASGAVDGWGPSWSTTAFGAVPLGMLALFYVVPQVDPKARAYAAASRFYLGFVCAMTAIMCGMSWLGELTVWGVVPATGSVNALVGAVVGLLLIGIGNYLPRVRQNYTMGVKTPWALADPDNWRRTQRFGGVCLMVAGVVVAASGLAASLLPAGGVMGAIVVATLCAVVAPGAYSYLLWRRGQRG